MMLEPTYNQSQNYSKTCPGVVNYNLTSMDCFTPQTVEEQVEHERSVFNIDSRCSGSL